MRIISSIDALTLTYDLQRGRKLSECSFLPRPPLDTSFSFNKDLQNILYGRHLTNDDLSLPLSEMQSHLEKGYLNLDYGVFKKNGNWFCNRCGNNNLNKFAVFHCARCGENCTYCRSCIMMGRICECTPFFTWSGPALELPPLHNSLVWSGALSAGQANASKKMIESIKAPRSLLVWAVCGAGKTEILFEGIQEALAAGKRVCIATPRTDVVLELSPRLKNAFPNANLAVLYGGSEDRGKLASLTISTTHQLLRYNQAFDVLIIDEVDAFPYSLDETLQFAAEKARKPQGTLIYLSATPSKKMQHKVERRKLDCVKIPARYHGHTLPVPSFEWCGNWRKALEKRKLPQTILNWVLNQIDNQKQAFIFAPRIEFLNKIVDLIKPFCDLVDSVHAEDPERKEKVLAFREGKTLLLVTTTILERGVTIPNSDVAVLGAEDSIFTESALVQIAGRVGRHPDYPGGDVFYFHYGKTEAMIQAKNHIEAMNSLAKKSNI
ncbi:DEAD/DEAH box helicase [Metabacillus arenae]|uniref:DEAD/DEAH box helicase n=1 Tax=Metabacillus arenae TaxID=2771434 RepID=A0A926NNW7_9BACI|nr:DEAD/DEAH box helicase [Metabacillus arenae]MBD1381387.1 DEAD/DEAH box helicase [Metabacillus arenae]